MSAVLARPFNIRELFKGVANRYKRTAVKLRRRHNFDIETIKERLKGVTSYIILVPETSSWMLQRQELLIELVRI